MSGLGGPQFNETTSAGTFTPSKQTGLTQIIVDASCLTNGDVLVNVDGSLCSAYGEGCGVSTKIVNPTARLHLYLLYMVNLICIVEILEYMELK